MTEFTQTAASTPSRLGIAGVIEGMSADEVYAAFVDPGRIVRWWPDEADIDAVVGAIMAVAAFAEDQAETLIELDINPLIVGASGEGAVAADALIRMRENKT